MRSYVALSRARSSSRTTSIVVLLSVLGVLAGLLFSASASAAEAETPHPRDDPERVWLPKVRPAPARAERDIAGSSDAGCHAGPTAVQPVVCSFEGQGPQPRVVVVLGDSIAAQWWSAVRWAAADAGWELHWMTKTSCPAAAVTRSGAEGARYRECDLWRRAALERVRSLPDVDLVVLSGSTTSSLQNRSTGTVLVAGSDSWANEWRRGYGRTVRGLGDRVGRVALLRDTPSFPFDPGACLREAHGSTAPCSRDIGTALTSAAWRAEQEAVDDFDHVAAVDMSDWICRPGRCTPVTETRTLRYRDNHHLSDTYSGELGPALRERLESVLPPARPAVAAAPAEPATTEAAPEVESAPPPPRSPRVAERAS